MPYEISFENLPVGYSASSKKYGDTTVAVVVNEFTSSEDGDLFITRLEGFPAEIVLKLPKERGITPSKVDHLIAVLRRNKTATVYVNEVNMQVEARIKRTIKKGEAVFKDDIGDIHKLTLKEVNVPKEAGVLVLFSVGWRKGLYFDFYPIQPKNPIERSYDLSIILGQFYSYLLFQNRFKVNEETWGKLFEQKWFPFISLKDETITSILNYCKESWDIDELLSKIKDELITKIPDLAHKWHKNEFISPHMAFIDKAIEHYQQNDHISAISILYPRIEGIMRSFYLNERETKKVTQNNLVGAAIDTKNIAKHSCSLLLPEKFKKYLLDVYFANFDPKGIKPLSRHSVSHGVANANDFSLKGTTIGFLILDQLSYFISSQEKISDRLQMTT